MSDQVTLEIRLADQTFRLATSPDQKHQLELAAQLFNDKFAQLRKSSPTLDRGRLTIMLAMEFAQEILALNKTLQVYNHGEILLQNMLNDLEKDMTEIMKDSPLESTKN